MLYIWPYITFFSFPLLLPYFISLLAQLPFLRPLSTNWLQQTFQLPLTIARPRFLVTISVILIMSLVVHFNTIVHPFTLADNRHYTFYVFRHLLRHRAVKFIVAPIYFTCGWAALQALGGTERSSDPNTGKKKSGKRSRKGQAPNNTLSHSIIEDQGHHVSFVLIFLLSTALSLITAPLVEPRYFIIPWCIWRLNIPFIKASSPEASTAAEANGYTRVLLILETIWYLTINIGTGYMFLYRTFTWPSEPGQLQRFMW